MTMVIVLNGPGSAGKTSIAKAFQRIAARPFLHVAMDVFLDMLPERYMDHPDGLLWEKTIIAGQPVVSVGTGSVASLALHSMRRAVRALAESGNDLIVDDVMLENEWDDYCLCLQGLELKLVGVSASLEVLESREAQRGDRMIGLARAQFERVHLAKPYDLKLDTDNCKPEDCARMICNYFKLQTLT